MRRLASLVVACLLTPLAVLPVDAETSTTITTNVTVGAAHTPPNGAWGFSDGCETGISGGQEYRCAFEFDISALGSSAKVTSAVLSIRRSGGCITNDCPVNIYSYTGNGSADLSDVTQGSSPIATWTPNTTTTHQWNVLGYIQAHATNGDGWAGFRLSIGSGNSALQDFDISSGSKVSLAVSYFSQPVDVHQYLSYTEVGAAGKVTSNPAGIDCGTTCTATFEYADVVTLTAVLLNGQTSFVSWSGDVPCNEGQFSLTCTFVVPSVPPNINATFTASGPAITQAPPTPSPTIGRPPTPGPSAHATPKPSTGPGATTQPGQTSTPGQSSVPAASVAPGPSTEPGATGASGSEPPSVAPLETPNDVQNAAGQGGVPIVLILLVAVLAIAVGGGAWYAAKRRQGA